ncbi:unnamed protein product [Tetraodon nigroviridis]|uniref:(spotted green pufferfish) hypothetical protein n=1 Tax=Tetraodon nigroviridis TaxID=99883 RepID=Q4TIA6_TETNG|nr:unnamed protein product [Tetraodon nigroviridis]
MPPTLRTSRRRWCTNSTLADRHDNQQRRKTYKRALANWRGSRCARLLESGSHRVPRLLRGRTTRSWNLQACPRRVRWSLDLCEVSGSSEPTSSPRRNAGTGEQTLAAR